MENKIPAKLHLGDKTLTSDIIAYGTQSIGDWAYAHCSTLKSLALPDTVHILGKDVFLGCDSLQHVYYYKDPSFSSGMLPADKDTPFYWIARLNALAMLYFHAPLSVLINEPSAHGDAYRSWDENCLIYLCSSDESGFSPFLAGGEEDYSDNDEQQQTHIRRIKHIKAHIIYIRLLSEISGGLQINDDIRCLYLNAFSSNPEALSLLNEIDSHHSMAALIYTKAGLVTAETLPSILDQLEPDRIEIRSAIISHTGDRLLNDLTL